MFGFTVWLVIGGIVGWIASVVTRTDEQHSILATIIIGVIGAYIGGALLAPTIRAASPVTHVIALAGAIIAVSALALVQRTRRR